MTAHVTPSHDGLSSAPVRPLIFAGMLPRKRGTEGEQLGIATTQLCPARRGGHAARRWAQLDRETAGQRGQARSECGRMAQGYWPQRRTSSGSSGLRSFGSNKQGAWLLRQLQSVTSHYTCTCTGHVLFMLQGNSYALSICLVILYSCIHIHGLD